MSPTFLQRLDRTARDARAVARAASARWACAVALAGATLLVLVDWLGRFHDTGLRWLFTAALVGGVVLVARGAWRRLRPRDATRLGIAQRLQRLRPELGSRLASAVEFAESDPADGQLGSAELRRAVVLDVSSSADGLPYEGVIDRAPLLLATRTLCGAAAALAALGLANPAALATGLYRLAAPWADAPWPREVRLKLVEYPAKLARGAAFEGAAENELGPLPDDTRVEYRFAASDSAQARRESVAAKLVGEQAVAARERVGQSFAFRFVGGDDDTMPWAEVEVIDAPAAESFRVSILPPPYSGLAASESAGAVRVLEGTTLAATGVATQPLRAARIELPEGTEVAADVLQATEFSTTRDDWVAVAGASGEYRVRLDGESGVTGAVGPHPYEVVKDTPPRVEWDSAADDWTLPAGAVAPVRAAATDDLAVRSIRIEWSRPEEGAPLSGADVFDGGETPPAREALGKPDRRAVAHDWDLAGLDLEEGEELSVRIVATDYRGLEGRTESPRRLAIVSAEEFLRRLGEKQSRLLGLVQQALGAQRDAADATRELGADTRDAAAIARRELDRLTSLEYRQREASTAVDDPATGAAAAAAALADELRRSRVEAPDLAEQLAGATDALTRLARNELAAARSELASARRAGKRSARGEAPAAQEFAERLQEASSRQGEAVEGLERVADLLTSWADFQRFAAEAAALESLQRELAAESQRQAAAAASKISMAPTQADREKLLTRQAEASRRFDKLRQAMQRLMESQPAGAKPTQASEAVADAVGEAAEADVAGRLREAASELARGRPGAAAQPQQRAADGIRSMLESLRQRTTSDPAELAKRLAAEKKKLAELREEVARLAGRPDTAPTKSARQRAAERASRQARRLTRLTASEAGESTQSGAQSTSGEGEPGGSREQLAKADREFQKAERQIERRLRELDNQQTQRVLDQLAARIGGYLQRQTAVLDATLGLAAGDPNQGQADAVSRDERDLAEEVGAFAEKLAKRAVFEIALRSAAEDASAAALRLARNETDRPTQRLETSALRRLERVQEVLRQNQQDQENRDPNAGGGGGGGGGEPPPPSAIDVAELKMLRLLQLEVLAETDAYEADAATARRAGVALPPSRVEAARELAQRQRRLAELAAELSERDNDPDAEDAAQPQE